VTPSGGAVRAGPAWGHREAARSGLDGGADWDRATRWHYEPGGFRPLAKETAEGELLYIVTDHLGTPREMFGEDGKLRWAAEYRTWGDIRRLWKPDAANDNAEAPRAPPAPRYSTRWDRLEQEDGDRPAGRPGPPRHSGPAGGRVYGALALKDETAFAEARLECPIRFQGQWEDEESGLYYNRFRYYDPAAGQYVSPDPIGLRGGVRPHTCVIWPTVWVDPLGLEGGEPPPSLTPPGAGRRGAFRAAKRANKIPCCHSQLPSLQISIIQAKRSRVVNIISGGRTIRANYIFEMTRAATLTR
jgi:RHS repeat-associated protein